MLQGLAAIPGLTLATSAMTGAQVAFADTANADDGYDGDTLVLVTLWGGFDGLTAVPPIADPGYASARPSIAVPAGAALPLDSTFAFHPALKPLLPLYNNKQLAVVQAVKTGADNRSHFLAQQELGEAAPGSSLRSGWLNRTLGTWSGTDALRAVQVGDSVMTSSLVGPRPATTLWEVGNFTLAGQQWFSQLPDTMNQLYSSVSGGQREAALATVSATGQLASLTASPPPIPQSYPTDGLGPALAGVASLIKAGAGVRIAAVDYGSWDFHGDLGQAGGGAMATMLANLAQSLAAFNADLGSAMGRVTLVTLSEFGRTVVENGSAGVDHGDGNVMFVLGGNVNGGQIYGNWPTIDTDSLTANALRGTTDYRSVLGELLVRRCGVGSLTTVFPQFQPSFLGVAKS
jgi:uncharacterized protein (DUF1501 family)